MGTLTQYEVRVQTARQNRPSRVKCKLSNLLYLKHVLPHFNWKQRASMFVLLEIAYQQGVSVLVCASVCQWWKLQSTILSYLYFISLFFHYFHYFHFLLYIPTPPQFRGRYCTITPIGYVYLVMLVTLQSYWYKVKHSILNLWCNID